MDFRPPPPRAPGSGGLRKQALAGAHRSGGGKATVPTVLEDGVGGEPGPAEPLAEAPSSFGRSVELRPWQDYWDACQQVEIPGR